MQLREASRRPVSQSYLQPGSEMNQHSIFLAFFSLKPISSRYSMYIISLESLQKDDTHMTKESIFQTDYNSQIRCIELGIYIQNASAQRTTRSFDLLFHPRCSVIWLNFRPNTCLKTYGVSRNVQ